MKIKLKTGKEKPIELIPLKLRKRDIEVRVNGFTIPDNEIKKVKHKNGTFTIILKKSYVFNELITVTCRKTMI